MIKKMLIRKIIKTVDAHMHTGLYVHICWYQLSSIFCAICDIIIREHSKLLWSIACDDHDPLSYKPMITTSPASPILPLLQFVCSLCAK